MIILYNPYNLNTNRILRKLLNAATKDDKIRTSQRNVGRTLFLSTYGGSKYSQNYSLEKNHNFSGIAEAGVALLIFATAFLWLFL